MKREKDHSCHGIVLHIKELTHDIIRKIGITTFNENSSHSKQKKNEGIMSTKSHVEHTMFSILILKIKKKENLEIKKGFNIKMLLTSMPMILL